MKSEQVLPLAVFSLAGILVGIYRACETWASLEHDPPCGVKPWGGGLSPPHELLDSPSYGKGHDSN